MKFLALLLALLIATPSFAISLGDLDLPESRLPTKQGLGAEAGWVEPADAGWTFKPGSANESKVASQRYRLYPVDIDTWTEYNMTDPSDMSTLGCGTMSSAVGNDATALNCAVRSGAGDPDGRILYIPAGNYEMSTRVIFLDGNSDNLMIRGDGDSTVIDVPLDIQSVNPSGEGDECSRRRMLYVCPGNSSSNSKASSSWTAGFTEDTRTITVANGSVFSGQTHLVLSGVPGNPDGKWKEDQFVQLFEIESINSNDITLTEGLTTDMTGGTSRVAIEGKDSDGEGSDNGVIENVGIEDLKITNTGHPNSNVLNLTGPLGIQLADGVWVRGVTFENTWNNYVRVDRVKDLLMEGNAFNDMANNDDDGGSAVYWRKVHDSWFVNNWHSEDLARRVHRLITLEDSPNRTVIAYNFGPDTNNRHERFVFFHGDNPSGNLVEGNVWEEGRMEIDNTWGRQGPKNTFFKNSERSPLACHKDSNNELATPYTKCDEDSDCDTGQSCKAYGRNGIVTEVRDIGSVSSFRNIVDPNFVLNTTGGFGDWGGCKVSGGNQRSSDACRGFDEQSQGYPVTDFAIENFWMESNLAFAIQLFPGVGDINSICDGNPASDRDECFTAGDTNVEGTSLSCASAGYTTLPASLYRDTKPEWWCNEACDWATLTGVGACGEDRTGTALLNRTNCQIPAEIQWDIANGVPGATCTLTAAPFDFSVSCDPTQAETGSVSYACTATPTNFDTSVAWLVDANNDGNYGTNGLNGEPTVSVDPVTYVLTFTLDNTLFSGLFDTVQTHTIFVKGEDFAANEVIKSTQVETLADVTFDVTGLDCTNCLTSPCNAPADFECTATWTGAVDPVSCDADTDEDLVYGEGGEPTVTNGVFTATSFSGTELGIECTDSDTPPETDTARTTVTYEPVFGGQQTITVQTDSTGDTETDLELYQLTEGLNIPLEDVQNGCLALFGNESPGTDGVKWSHTAPVSADTDYYVESTPAFAYRGDSGATGPGKCNFPASSRLVETGSHTIVMQECDQNWTGTGQTATCDGTEGASLTINFTVGVSATTTPQKAGTSSEGSQF